jgi:hypothetical protein
MVKNYSVYFSVGGGQTTGNYDGYASKAEALKAVKEMIAGNCPLGQVGHWSVSLGGEEIKSGTYNPAAASLRKGKPSPTSAENGKLGGRPRKARPEA